MENRIDKPTYYKRRNSLLINDIQGMRDENTDRIAVAVYNERLNLELSHHKTDRIERIIGTSTLNKIKPRPIAITFLRYAGSRKAPTNKTKSRNWYFYYQKFDCQENGVPT